MYDRKLAFAVRLFVYAFAGYVLGVVLAAIASAQSPELQAKMHVCALRVDNWYGQQADSGSGVLVDLGGKAYVVTNHHVAADRAGTLRITYPDGQRGGGRIVSTDAQMDVCVIEPAGNVTGGAPLGCFDPSETHYIACFGTHALRFEPLTHGRPLQFADDPLPATAYAATTTSGDSGGGIFNEAGELCGIHRGKLGDGTATGLTGQAFDRQLVAIGQRVAPQQLLLQRPTRCINIGGGTIVCGEQPVYDPRAAGSRLPTPAPPAASAVAPPKTSAAQACDCRAEVATLKAELDALKARQPVAGAQVNVDELAAKVAAKLPPIRVKQKDYYTGDTLDEGTVSLGETLVLRFGVKHARPQ